MTSLTTLFAAIRTRTPDDVDHDIQAIEGQVTRLEARRDELEQSLSNDFFDDQPSQAAVELAAVYAKLRGAPARLESLKAEYNNLIQSALLDQFDTLIAQTPQAWEQWNEFKRLDLYHELAAKLYTRHRSAAAQSAEKHAISLDRLIQQLTTSGLPAEDIAQLRNRVQLLDAQYGYQRSQENKEALQDDILDELRSLGITNPVKSI